MFLYKGVNELISQKIGGSLVRISANNLQEIPTPFLKRGEELKGVALLDSATYLIATTLGFYTLKVQIEKELTEKAIISVKNEKLQAEIEHKSSQLATNTIAIIRKNELLTTIKEELELMKQELGDRFPKKYFTKLIRLIDSNLKDELEWEAFEQLYDQAHGDFFKRLKERYPELTPGDLRLCAYLRMNLASKEIAPLLNISVRGVEERRYRLRKRLNLSADTNLTETLMTF